MDLVFKRSNNRDSLLRLSCLKYVAKAIVSGLRSRNTLGVRYHLLEEGDVLFNAILPHDKVLLLQARNMVAGFVRYHHGNHNQLRAGFDGSCSSLTALLGLLTRQKA